MRKDSRRQGILENLALVGREHSDATVLFHSQVAEHMGLGATDYKVLGILQRLGPLTASTIAEHSGLANTSVTARIDRLERKGFARRTRTSSDRRQVVVEPNHDRLQGGKEFFKSAVASLKRLYETYSDTQLETIADFLTRNSERLRTETSKLSRKAT